MSAVVMVRDSKRIYAGPHWTRSAPLTREQEFVDWHRERGYTVVVFDGRVYAPQSPIDWDCQ